MDMHPCLSAGGKAPGCEDCPFLQRGFCEAWINTLEKIDTQLEARYVGIPREGRRCIIDETFQGGLIGVPSFRGTARFTTWIWSIYKRKRADHFRRDFRKKKHEEVPLESIENTSSLAHDPDIEEWIDRRRIAGFIKIHMSVDCIQLLVDFVECQKTGRTRKDLAEEYGISPNTLYKRLSRCSQKIRRLLEEQRFKDRPELSLAGKGK